MPQCIPAQQYKKILRKERSSFEERKNFEEERR
jgi:hypothetical protein